MKKPVLSRMAFVVALAVGAVGCQEESLAPKNDVKSSDVVIAGNDHVQSVTADECTGPRLQLLPGGPATLQGGLLFFNVQILNTGSATAFLDQPGNALIWNAFLSVDGTGPGPNPHFTASRFVRPIAPFSTDFSSGFFSINPGEDLSIYKFIVIQAQLTPGNTVGDCSGGFFPRILQPLIVF